MARADTTYRLLVQLLHPHLDRSAVESVLKQAAINWEHIVVVASKELVLPTLYCNLHRLDLLDYLPDDLKAYLEDLTTINRNRNQTLLEEVFEIHRILEAQTIDHVFLKGAALLASGFYDDLGVRMVGDIDVLVAPKDLELAQACLIQNGYQEIPITFGNKYFEHKHLPRLFSDTRLGAVEVHRKLLAKPTLNLLNPKAVLASKQVVADLPIPNISHLMTHAVLNFQVNDTGAAFGFLSLRSAYDVLVLDERLSQKSFNQLIDSPPIRAYFNKLQVYAAIQHPYPLSTKDRLLQWGFKVKQGHWFALRLWNTSIRFGRFVRVAANRSWLFISNRNYRKDCYRDRHRVFRKLLHMKP